MLHLDLDLEYLPEPVVMASRLHGFG